MTIKAKDFVVHTSGRKGRVAETFTFQSENAEAATALVYWTDATESRVPLAELKPLIKKVTFTPKAEEPRSTYGEDTRRGELSDDLGESPDY